MQFESLETSKENKSVLRNTFWSMVQKIPLEFHEWNHLRSFSPKEKTLTSIFIGLTKIVIPTLKNGSMVLLFKCLKSLQTGYPVSRLRRGGKAIYRT